MRTAIAIVVAAMTLVVAGRAVAQTYDSGSTGADGAFTLPNAGCPTSPNCTVTLPASGEFHFTTVNIPSPWYVKFTKNAANTPVVIRAQGSVTIAGTIDVSGAAGGNGAWGITILGPNGGLGGPGGFNGGSGGNGIVSTTGGVGVGPGGGGGGDQSGGNGQSGGGAGFATAGATASPGGAGGAAYGTPSLLPIVGGSGGGGGGAQFGWSAGGGGGGGGALVIASSGTITLGASGVQGKIFAKGGNGGGGSICCPSGGGGGGGSGGAVRLAATTITSAGSNGQIDVSGGTGMAGSRGRIRIEAYTNTAQVNLTGAQASVVLLPRPVLLANTPTLRIAAVGGIATPPTPLASLGIPDVVLPATTTNPVQISLTASQVPLGTTILVSVKGQTGVGSSVVSSGLTGTVASSTATANVTLPTNQPSIIGASATFDLVASSGQGPVYAEGERVERVRVVASLGGAAQVTYITASGREITATPPQ